MRNEKFSAKDLLSMFKIKKVIDLDEIKTALGTQGTMTVFRKLKQLSYFNSYSHRWKYYTIKKIAKFNEKGLWFFRSVRFSKYGTLMKTAKVFVNFSNIGCSAREFWEELEVDVQETLLRLSKDRMIFREKMSGVYIYAFRQCTSASGKNKRGHISLCQGPCHQTRLSTRSLQPGSHICPAKPIQRGDSTFH